MVVHILLLQEEMLVYNKGINMKIRKRKILITDLVIQASVGVYEHEKQNKQKIVVNLELLLSNDSEYRWKTPQGFGSPGIDWTPRGCGVGPISHRASTGPLGVVMHGPGIDWTPRGCGAR